MVESGIITIPITYYYQCLISISLYSIKLKSRNILKILKELKNSSIFKISLSKKYTQCLLVIYIDQKRQGLEIQK